MYKGDVVQFNENHKWCGCLGIINEIKTIHTKNSEGVIELKQRYMVGVPDPQGGTAYIYVVEDEYAIEYIGKAKLVPKGEEENG